MDDKNVVRVDFAKRRVKSGPASPPAPREPEDREVSEDYKDIGPLSGEALLRAQRDLVYALANMQFVQEMRDKLERAGDEIFSLKDYVADQESIRLRRQGLRTYTLEDICNEVLKTHKLQWRRQPSYLGALTLEHHYRVQTALSLMPSESEGVTL